MKKATVFAGAGVVSLVIVGGLFVTSASERHSAVTDDMHAVRSNRFADGRVERSLSKLAHGHQVVPLRAPSTPPSARTTAVRYVLDAFSTVAGQPTDGWVHLVAPMCAPNWLRHIENANNAQRIASTTVQPQLISTFGSWSPVRAVGVTVVVRVNRSIESLYVELRKERGHYLIEAAQ